MNTSTNSLKTWCSVNLDAIAHNYNYTKSKTRAEVICIIKADAYGHGAVKVACRLEDEGCTFFAVSSIEEALELRHGGIKGSILVLGYILPSRIEEAIREDISFACASYDFAKALCSTNVPGKKARIHIKLNTGMNRTGFNVCLGHPDDGFNEAISLISQSDNITVEGVFSHFAAAECDEDFSSLQCDRLLDAVKQMESFGIKPQMIHICNSSGAEKYPEMHFDAVRLGIHLYGHESADGNYVPAMEFLTRIVDIHTLCEGDGVSYGLDFIAQDNMKIAVVGAGYADGVLRCLSNGKGNMMVHGVKCPIIGRVCMDMTMIDISGVPDAKVGDVVTIWGEGLSCREQAENAGTISYELLCSISPRVKRVYL